VTPHLAPRAIAHREPGLCVKNVSLVDVSENAPVLNWTNPDRLVCDEQTPPNIVEKIPGAICEAPIHLPLRVMSENTALKVTMKDTVALKKADAPRPFSLEKVVLASMRREEEMKNKGKVLKVRPKARG
jgi:hypothetical protein